MNKIKIILSLFVLMFFIGQNFLLKEKVSAATYTAEECASLKDKLDDSTGGLKWTNWDDFCSGCPGEYCCRKDGTCKCPCEAKYCVTEKITTSTTRYGGSKEKEIYKCVPYAKSCGCYDFSSGILCGKNPFGKVVCGAGASYYAQCLYFMNYTPTHDGYKACFTDANCAKCPSYSPNYPTAKCDYTTKKCVKTYECGVSTCSKDSECCGKEGEVMPHYECDTSTGYPRKCKLVNTCGKSQCDPKDDKINSVTGDTYNPKCTKYSCDQNTWKCNIDMTGGIYFGDAACKADCVLGYVCDQKTWKCNVKPSGTYKTKDDCTKVCKEPEPKYMCNLSTWKCEVKSSGESLTDCNKKCVNPDQPTPKYSCNKDTGKCVVDAKGTYTKEFNCNSACIKVVNPPTTAPATKYACNSATKTCSISATGTYSNLSACNTDCKADEPLPPTSCWIDDYSIKPLVLGILSVKAGLKWFTADWYTTGDCKNCSLYVKTPSSSDFMLLKSGLAPISTYDIKDFLQTSGSYMYKLICYGKTDTPEETITVKILPFMIWYEVNPVFPSRFKNIESMPGA